MTNSKTWAIGALIVVPMLFSSNMILARYLHNTVPPIQLAFWRWTFAFLTALAFAWPVLGVVRRGLWLERWRIIVLGFLGMAFCGPAVYQAAKTISAVDIGLVYAASPVFIGIFSSMMGAGKPHSAGWAGIGLAFCGVFLILSEGHPSAFLEHFSPAPGLLWVIAATIAWALYTVILRQRAKDIPEDAYLLAVCGAGVALLAPLLLVEGQGLVVATLHAKEWIWLIFLGIAPSFLAYRGYTHVQKELGLLAAGSILFLTPLVNSLLASVILGEGISAFHLYGGAAIFLGTALILRYPAQKAVL